MALYTPFSSQLTDITKVNFQLLFSGMLWRRPRDKEMLFEM